MITLITVLPAAMVLIGVPLMMWCTELADDRARSRTPGGSTNADGGSPQTPSARWTGAESPEAEAVETRPVHPNLVGAPSRTSGAPTRSPDSLLSPQTPAGTSTGTPLPVRACRADLPVGGATPAASPTGFQGGPRG